MLSYFETEYVLGLQIRVKNQLISMQVKVTIFKFSYYFDRICVYEIL